MDTYSTARPSQELFWWRFIIRIRPSSLSHRSISSIIFFVQNVILCNYTDLEENLHITVMFQFMSSNLKWINMSMVLTRTRNMFIFVSLTLTSIIPFLRVVVWLLNAVHVLFYCVQCVAPHLEVTWHGYTKKGYIRLLLLNVMWYEESILQLRVTHEHGLIKVMTFYNYAWKFTGFNARINHWRRVTHVVFKNYNIV